MATNTKALAPTKAQLAVAALAFNAAASARQLADAIRKAGAADNRTRAQFARGHIATSLATKAQLAPTDEVRDDLLARADAILAKAVHRGPVTAIKGKTAAQVKAWNAKNAKAIKEGLMCSKAEMALRNAARMKWSRFLSEHNLTSTDGRQGNTNAAKAKRGTKARKTTAPEEVVTAVTPSAVNAVEAMEFIQAQAQVMQLFIKKNGKCLTVKQRNLLDDFRKAADALAKEGSKA